MKRHRPKFDRYRNRQVGTRRQILEAALAAERIWMWQDFHEAWGRGDEDQMIFLAHRIRFACEALGYVTEWTAVPEEMLYHYEAVETVWRLSLVAQRWERREIACEPAEVDDGLRSALYRLAESWGTEPEEEPDA